MTEFQDIARKPRNRQNFRLIAELEARWTDARFDARKLRAALTKSQLMVWPKAVAAFAIGLCLGMAI